MRRLSILIMIYVVLCIGISDASTITMAEKKSDEWFRSIDGFDGGIGGVNNPNRNAVYDSAIANYNKALQRAPNIVDVLNARGNAYTKKNLYDKALEDYNRAISMKPSDAMLYYNRGVAYTKMGQQNKAIQDFNKAIAIQPSEIAGKLAQQNLDTLSNSSADNSDQEKEAQESGSVAGKAKEPDAVKSDQEKEAQEWFEKGNAYGGNKDFDKAIEAYGKAISLNPKYSEAYFIRGYVYADKEQYEAAIRDYSKVIELTPSSSVAYNNRAHAYRPLGQYDKAIADCNKAIELDNTYLLPYFNRARAYEGKGDFDKAIKDYKIVIEHDPMGESAKTAQSQIEVLPGIIIAQGDIFSGKENYDKAIELYTKAIELSPENAEAFFSRGDSYAALDDNDKAIADYSKVITIEPKNARVSYRRALLYFKQEKFDRAIRDFSEVIKLDKKYIVAYYRRGRSYEEKGEMDKALGDYRKAIETYARAEKESWPDKIYVDVKDIEGNIQWILKHKKYERYIKLYKSTKPAKLSCGYSMNETNGVGKLSIGNDIYVSYQSGQGITDVKIPGSLSQELTAMAKSRGYKIGMSLELPFFVWFAENVLGTEDPEESMTGLCYLTAMVKKSQFDTIQTFVGGYLDSLGKKK